MVPDGKRQKVASPRSLSPAALRAAAAVAAVTAGKTAAQQQANARQVAQQQMLRQQAAAAGRPGGAQQAGKPAAAPALAGAAASYGSAPQHGSSPGYMPGRIYTAMPSSLAMVSNGCHPKCPESPRPFGVLTKPRYLFSAFIMAWLLATHCSSQLESLSHPACSPSPTSNTRCWRGAKVRERPSTFTAFPCISRLSFGPLGAGGAHFTTTRGDSGHHAVGWSTFDAGTALKPVRRAQQSAARRRASTRTSAGAGPRR